MNQNMRTQFGSLSLNSPVVVGSCPLTAKALQRIAMVDNGAGAMVLPSLIESTLASCTPGDLHCPGVEDYKSQLEHARENLSIPLIASLRSQSGYDWGDIPALLEGCGADAIEFSVRKTKPSQAPNPRKIEDGIVAAAKRIHQSVSIPVFVKLTRNYTSISALAVRLSPFIDGLILFGNKPVLDIHLDSLNVTSHWELTESGCIGQSIESLMRIKECCPDLSLAACGGIASSEDVIRALLAGASVTMATSAIYRCGVTVIGTMLEGLANYMDQNSIDSLDGLASKRPAYRDIDFEALDRESSTSKPTNTIENHPTECDRWGHPTAPALKK